MTMSAKNDSLYLASSDDSFKTLFYLSPVGMAISTLSDGRFIEVNEPYCVITGYTRDELIGKSSIELSLLGESERRGLLENVQRVGFIRNVDMNLMSASGEIRVVATSIHQAKFNGQDCLITSAMDITERKRLEEELEYLAQTDVLTGLSNRRHFSHLAELEMSRCIRYDGEVSVLMLDIDHFKEINDTYGHHVGDLVIHELGRLFKSHFRDIDILGRIGGEEFAAVLPQTGIKAATHAAERIRQAAADAQIPIENAQPIHFTVSIGIQTGRGANISLNAFLDQADKALYEAKRNGRNRVCLAPQ